MKFVSLSLRTKLIFSFLIIIMFGGLISLSFGYRLVKNTIISQAQSKVRHDLASARMVFNEKLNYIGQIVSLNAEIEEIQDNIRRGELDTLLIKLSQMRKKFGLDIMTLTDPIGRVVVRSKNPEVVGDDQSQDEIIKWTLKRGYAAKPQIMFREELLKEGKDLADKACIEFIQTPKAVPWLKDRETSGMILKAASSIKDKNGSLIGVLYGGILLNKNYEIVDRVKDIVFKGEKYKDRETGTATIFLHDLRISTNVKNERNERAIGTKVSKEVHNAVLMKGESWIHRAFVVNDWYITAYEPIHNINNEIIGILYVGMLEKPYIDTTKRVMLVFILMSFLCVVLLLAMLYFSTTRIINPLRNMVVVTQEIAKGDLNHEVKVNSKDEIGDLADSFNKMTANLKAANKELINWGKTLEKKIAERTKELGEAQAHLFQAAKLASLGELAAGVAHEINNPLGGILIYSHLLLEGFDKKSPYCNTLDKIIKESTRCKEIVKGLLEFARPKEPKMTLLQVNGLLDKSLSLVESQSLFHNIRVVKQYSADIPLITADSTQIQQVFMNIILNAADAMQGSGVLTLGTSLDTFGNNLVIDISDTGSGIKKEDKNKIFDPFFTTKEVGQGTGLGLSVSYNIIQKHHGTIEVQSTFGKGSTFSIKLPVSGETQDG